MPFSARRAWTVIAREPLAVRLRRVPGHPSFELPVAHQGDAAIGPVPAVFLCRCPENQIALRIGNDFGCIEGFTDVFDESSFFTVELAGWGSQLLGGSYSFILQGG